MGIQEGCSDCVAGSVRKMEPEWRHSVAVGVEARAGVDRGRLQDGVIEPMQEAG
jgi:hypothetical protein